jgi:DNA-binding transcriptional LysR family regulator
MTTRETAGDLELGLLRTFVRVVNHGSLCKAAAAAKMTQPAVSQQILRLEKIVGEKIFVRGRDGVSLTRHGKLLLSHAHVALELSAETLRKLHGEDIRSDVALGVSTKLALTGLRAALKRFEFLHPSLQLSVAVVPTPSTASVKRSMPRAGQLRTQGKNGHRSRESAYVSRTAQGLLHGQDENLDGGRRDGWDW